MAPKPSFIFRGTDEAEEARRRYERSLTPEPRPQSISAAWLRSICLEAGADDVGFVEVGREALGGEGENARRIFPDARTLVSVVGVSNREAIRSTSRATANSAWHRTGEHLETSAELIIERLREVGVRGVATNIGFPMDVHAPPGHSTWAIAHKIVAVEAGMGHMGTNRNVIHPKFGNFILLDTLLIDVELDRYDSPLDFNPCNGCNLCVAACPVGAISSVKEFDFFACLGHNYREFPLMAADWLATVSAGDSAAYRAKFREAETTSMLQSFAFEPSYKSAYCMAVCPAGEDVIGEYSADKARYREKVLIPLRQLSEVVYVQSGTPAEASAHRNPVKDVRYLDFDPSASTPANFAIGLRHMFRSDRNASPEETLRVAFHFANGDVLATVEGKRLTAHDLDGRPVDASVRHEGPDYITLLHTVGTDASSGLSECTISGDSAAVERLFSMLD